MFSIIALKLKLTLGKNCIRLWLKFLFMPYSQTSDTLMALNQDFCKKKAEPPKPQPPQVKCYVELQKHAIGKSISSTSRPSASRKNTVYNGNTQKKHWFTYGFWFFSCSKQENLPFINWIIRCTKFRCCCCSALCIYENLVDISHRWSKTRWENSILSL